MIERKDHRSEEGEVNDQNAIYGGLQDKVHKIEKMGGKATGGKGGLQY